MASTFSKAVVVIEPVPVKARKDLSEGGREGKETSCQNFLLFHLRVTSSLHQWVRET